jgi:DNA-binding NtrC family response regulator
MRSARLPSDTKNLKAGFLIVSGSKSDLLERSLSEGGAFARKCRSGQQALVLLRNQKFDGILCDLGSRRSEAMNLLAEIGRNCPAVAFVMIAKRRDVRLGMLALIAGASGYLLKPSDASAILAVANAALAKKRLDLRLRGHHKKVHATW